MATHSSTLPWKIPWTEEPGRLQSMGSLKVGHDRATSLSLFTFMHWRRKWQPTPVFLPGESQRWKSLVGCHLWGCTELDTTEATQQQQLLFQDASLSFLLTHFYKFLSIYFYLFHRTKVVSFGSDSIMPFHPPLSWRISADQRRRQKTGWILHI